MQAVAAIPARLESSRLPRKVLVDIAGRPMLWHVWTRCCEAFSTRQVYIATDSREVLQVAQAWNARVLMTSRECRSGTERIATALNQIDGDVIINVQGDEPMIDPRLLARLADVCGDCSCVVTPVYRITESETLEDPNTVKVLCKGDGYALYFSRAAVPFYRGLPASQWVNRHRYLGHVGVYAFPRHVLRGFATLPTSPLETAERLEQLRLLDAGVKIRTIETDYRAVAVDTVDDLRRVRALMHDASGAASIIPKC